MMTDRKTDLPENLPPAGDGLEWYFIKARKINGKLHPAFINSNGEEVDGIWITLTDDEARYYGLKEEKVL